jgi:hypothetical protein
MSLPCRYFLETMEHPVGPGHPAWSSPLPVSRRAESTQDASACTYGDYFEGVRLYLEGGGRVALARALAHRGLPGEPAEIRIFLAKHGEYYHPARLEASAAGAAGEWVVNVAVSEAGRSLLNREHSILQRLGGRSPAFLPEVYGWGEVEGRPGIRLGMMLAEWFSGFHEFHLTRPPAGGLGLVLWDPAAGNRLLSSAQTVQVYRDVARILTSCLNLKGFEAVGAWHHAAGDFIVRPGPRSAEVRLITAREYRPVYANPPSDFQGLLNACLVYLLQISLRTRLDRLDGTGEMAWTGPEAVGPTVDGFLAGIAEIPFPDALPIPFARVVERYLAKCSPDVLAGLCADLIRRDFPDGSPERALAQAELEAHVRLLSTAFARD